MQQLCSLWIFIPFYVAIPIRTKRVVVDKHMEASRFEEEVELLEREIVSFLKFYSNNVLPSLEKEKQKLEALLKGTGQQSLCIFVTILLLICKRR